MPNLVIIFLAAYLSTFGIEHVHAITQQRNKFLQVERVAFCDYILN